MRDVAGDAAFGRAAEASQASGVEGGLEPAARPALGAIALGCKLVDRVEEGDAGSGTAAPGAAVESNE
jgi:hypothetical protein